MAAENDVFPCLGQWLAYASRHADTPEMSLGAIAGYHSAFFVRYLDRRFASRFGPHFTDGLWVDSAGTFPGQSALMYLEAQLRTVCGAVFCSADPEVKDVFASGFCRAAWFAHDPAEPGHEPEMVRHFGGRALTHSWELSAPPADLPDQRIEPLACRYYQFGARQPLQKIRIEITPTTPDPQLKAELVPLFADGHCPSDDEVICLRAAAGLPSRLLLDSDSVPRLKERLSKVPAWLLVVTNCALPPKDSFDLIYQHPLPTADFRIQVSGF